MIPRAIEEYIQDLHVNPLYLGVAIFGSYARGDNRSDSDIDVFVLTDSIEKRDIVRIANVNLEIVYSTEEGSRAFASKRMDSFLNMWRDAQIQFSKDGGLERLKKYAEQKEKEGKPALSDWQQKHAEFDIQDSISAVKALKDTDIVTAEMFLQRTVYNLLQYYFDKNCIWTPAPKKQLPWLRSNNVELADKFDAFYTTHILSNQIELAEDLINHILARL